ncbi:conserved membrane hypothetical protein [metagenome]|uniref:Uncharacterized protein n=1 Tax=metagenome TaxID=256318 RepID=A0A2P2C846_9ZZZZ
MSGLFDGDEGPKASGTAERPGRSRALLITTGVLIVGFLLLTGLSSFWTDRMWYSSVGYSDVFSRMLWTKVGLFAFFAVLMSVVVGLNMVLAYRFRPIFRPASAEQTSLDRYRDAITPIRRWLVIGVSLVLGAFAGTSAAGEWRNFMLWSHRVPFGKTDPYFDRDIGFYVFSLPWWHFVVDFAMAMAVVALLAAAVVHYLYGGIRLQSKHDRISGSAAVQLSVLLGAFMLFKAADYWLDRFDVLTGSGNLIDGMSYTDDNAVLPAKNILLGIAVVCALLFFLNIWRRSWMLPSVGVALFVLSAILLGLIWPGIVQQFQVSPSEADKEAPYITKTIQATRDAFNLGDISIETYDQAVDEPSVQELSDATAAVPLIDPKLVRDNFEQNQQQQGYYTVAPVLDVDRYTVDGTDRALVLGVRELDQSGLAESNKNWSNLHTVYTHGYGVIAAYGNQRDAADDVVPAETTPWAESGLPPTGALSDQQDDGYQGAIYFGEQSPDYSIVGKAEGGSDVEFDLPESSDGDKGTTTTYDGQAGVPLGGLWNQLLYAVKFGDPNIVLSSRVNANSKIIYDRDPTERVKKVAPWLQIDRDPYPAVVDGKVVWILDGFTTTDRYPLSDKQSYDDMTNDSLADTSQFQALPTDEINYMRNAVKATVDAYDGTVTLYEWDETDPMLQAWMGAFPETVQPKSEISPDLMAHLRYPEDLFKVQRYQYARYHVTDASDWYEGNDRWQVPQDPYKTGALQPPYRMFIDNPDTATTGSTFSMTSVYTPYKRENLVGFMDVNSDATQSDYGKIRVLRSPGQNIPGPGQVANSFANDEDVKNALSKFSLGGTTPKYGNLLTLPVDGKLLYVQPVYTVRNSEASYPILNAVITSFGQTGGPVGFGTSLPAAIADLLGGTLEPDNPPDTGNPGQGGNNLPADVRNLLTRAEAAFDAADAAFADGDTVTWAQEMERGRALIQRAIEAADSQAPKN